MKLKTKRMLAWIFIALVITISGMFMGVLLYGFIDYDIKICIALGTVSFWGIFVIQQRKTPSFNEY